MSNGSTGYMMKGAVKLSVDYQAGIPSGAVLGGTPLPPKPKIVHARNLNTFKGNVNMSFFMNKDRRDLNHVLEDIDRLGSQPAVFPEVESLRLVARKELSCLFSMAADHAKRRNVVSGTSFNRIGIPILGTSIFSKRDEFILMLVMHRANGSDWLELMPKKEVEQVHPAWLVPVVGK